MIKRLRVTNYKSIKESDLNLGNLNILIGPNGAGKSNLLSIFGLLHKASKGELANTISELGGKYRLLFSGEDVVTLSITFEAFDKGIKKPLDIGYLICFIADASGGLLINGEYLNILPASSQDSKTPLLHRSYTGDIKLYNEKKDAFDIKSSASDLLDQLAGDSENLKVSYDPYELAIQQFKDPSSYRTSYGVLNQLLGFAYHRPIDIGFNAPIRQGQTVRPDKSVREDGANLLSVLMNMHPDSRDELTDYLKVPFPEFKRIWIGSDSGGALALKWYETTFDDPFYITQISDGAIRLLYLLALLLSDSKRSLICIEEPEIGLHPEAIKVLGTVLKRVADKGEKQIIVSTHSNLLISEMDINDIIVTEKKAGATNFRRLSSDQLSKWLKEFSIGELWTDGHFED
jgi:predicted ATPase